MIYKVIIFCWNQIAGFSCWIMVNVLDLNKLSVYHVRWQSSKESCVEKGIAGGN